MSEKLNLPNDYYKHKTQKELVNKLFLKTNLNIVKN